MLSIPSMNVNLKLNYFDSQNEDTISYIDDSEDDSKSKSDYESKSVFNYDKHGDDWGIKFPTCLRPQ